MSDNVKFTLQLSAILATVVLFIVGLLVFVSKQDARGDKAYLDNFTRVCHNDFHGQVRTVNEGWTYFCVRDGQQVFPLDD